MDWSFITDKIWCLGFGSTCASMIDNLFSLASTCVLVNNILSPHIHCSIRQGFPLAPYLYVLITNAPGYIFENACVQGQIQGVILLYAFGMVNTHFSHDSLLSLWLDKEVVASSRGFLSMFCLASRGLYSVHKTITGWLD